jgi:Domain of unknown function (DUF6430)
VGAIGSDLRSKRFLGQWAKETFAAIGFLAVGAGLIDVLFADVFRDRGAAIALVVGVVSAGYGAIRAWPRPIQHSYSAPNTTIRIVKGDLFDEPGHIVIGTCDTFDTSIPNIISRQSLQGQALERLYGGDVTLLDRELGAALLGETPTGRVDKEGKTDRFPIGTVAAVPQAGRTILFVAYTEMSADNEARGTSDRVWKGLLSLWNACSRHCNGQAIAVPVIGGGQARIAQILPAQDAIRFIAFSYMLASRHEKVSDELRIVVRPDDYKRLDRLELQAFLDSLEPS